MSDAEMHFENAARNNFGGSLAQEAAGRAMEIKSKMAATTHSTNSILNSTSNSSAIYLK
jgi:hypothetical protein